VLPPTNPPCYPFIATFADDLSFIALNRHDAFVAWADWRTGVRQGLVSDIKLPASTFANPEHEHDDD
jgi:hypothetical protein